MGYPSCITLTNMPADCDAIKKPGGVKAKVWVGCKADLASLTFGTNGEVLTMTLKAGKKLAIIEGMQGKNSATFETVPAETRNTFTQTVSLNVYDKTAAQKQALQNLLIGDRYFFILETEAGQLKTYGLDKNPFNAADLGPERGLNVATGVGTTGILLADSTATVCTFAGQQYDAFNLYKPATAIETVKAELDALAA